MKPTTPLQFAAYIENVKEVALYGRADLAFWRERLARERLFPYNDHGRAGILISVPHLLWKGARFNELSISIAVSAREDGGARDGFFLAQAFNSLRMFAFAERTFFKTPYDYAEVQVTERIPAHFAVKHAGETMFEAKMIGERTPARRGVEHFEGPVHLPGAHYFIARISGMTDFFPFLPADVFSVRETTREDGVAGLRESNFTGLEWQIRGDAVHGKTKTYRRER